MHLTSPAYLSPPLPCTDVDTFQTQHDYNNNTNFNNDIMLIWPSSNLLAASRDPRALTLCGRGSERGPRALVTLAARDCWVSAPTAPAGVRIPTGGQSAAALVEPAAQLIGAASGSAGRGDLRTLPGCCA